MIIEMKNLTLRSDNGDILHNINWQVQAGENWAVLGLNGSGKTSMLNIINGYQWPTTGEISVLGHKFGRVDLRDLRKSIGWASSALQERLYGRETALEIVLSGKFATIGLYDQTTALDIAKAHHLLELLSSQDLTNRPYRQFSQGEKQKVLLARAMMASPQLLILDEPCTGLDLPSREKLLNQIQQISNWPDAPTLIYVTHHVEEILPIFQHTLLMQKGQIYAAGQTQDVLTSPNLSELYQTPVEVQWHNHRPWIHII